MMSWDGTFTLSAKEDGSTGFVSVPAEDVLYFFFHENQVKAQTSQQEYYAGWDSLDRLWKAIRGTDPRFYRTDRNYIANLARIRRLDEEWCKGYFEEHPDSRSKFCYIARVRMKEVQRRLAGFGMSGEPGGSGPIRKTRME